MLRFWLVTMFDSLHVSDPNEHKLSLYLRESFQDSVPSFLIKSNSSVSESDVL